jgi:hypothetical protein
VGPVNTPREAKEQAAILFQRMMPGSRTRGWRLYSVAIDEENRVWRITKNRFSILPSDPRAYILIRESDGKVLGFEEKGAAVLY